MANIALSPKGTGGICITESALASADIIVSTTNGLPSRIIKADTHSLISHVILYIGHHQVIEAILQGVVRRSLQEALHEATLAVAYRCKNLTAIQANLAIEYAKSLVDQKLKYDYGGAIGGGARANPKACVKVVNSVFLTLNPQPAFPAPMSHTSPLLAKQVCAEGASGAWQDPKRYYCSELVLESFKKAGIKISPVNPSVSVPQDIIEAYNRGTLEYVGHLRSGSTER
jgi:uncharacterized protein YycO